MIYKIIMVIAAYFIGNISPSILIGKAKGVDIRQEGSGNAGTTNALRVLGKKAAVITLLIDVLKGSLAASLGLIIFDLQMGCICAAAVFLGHIWPVLYKFKGGKGAATALGAGAAINWQVALIALAIAALFLLISKRMSVGSLVAAVSYPLLALWLEPEMVYLALFVTVIIFIKHRGNLVRLFKGEEPKMSIFK